MKICAVIVDSFPDSLDSCPLKRHLMYHTKANGTPVITVQCKLFEDEKTMKYFSHTISRCAFCPLAEEHKIEGK